jgi:hypothetical protein
MKRIAKILFSLYLLWVLGTCSANIWFSNFEEDIPAELFRINDYLFAFSVLATLVVTTLVILHGLWKW